MKITIDLNSVAPITVVNTVNEMFYPPIDIELDNDPDEFLKQLKLYINEYSAEFSEVLKRQFMDRVTERIATDLKKQKISIILK